MPGKANTVADALLRNISVTALSRIYNFSSSELRTAQQPQDTLLSKVIYVLESGDDSTLPNMPASLSAFTLNKDVLCRMWTVAKTQVTQVVIPTYLVETVLKLLHDIPQAGQPGRDRTLSMAPAKYYWPTKYLDTERYIA